MTPEPIVHIAAQDITIGGRRLRQRCAWCGTILLDYDLALVAVQNKPDGSPGDPPATWEPGALVRQVGNVMGVAEPDMIEGQPALPEEACANIDDEVTA